MAQLEIGETETSATVKVTAAADAPLGEVMVGLVVQTATSNGGGAARRADGPADQRATAAIPAVAAVMIAVEVVRPASVGSAPKAIVLKPGATTEAESD